MPPANPGVPQIPRGLPRRQANLLTALTHHSSITRREYELFAGISHTTASLDLQDLLAAGLVVRVGAARAARYTLPACYPPAIAQEPR